MCMVWVLKHLPLGTQVPKNFLKIFLDSRDHPLEDVPNFSGSLKTDFNRNPAVAALIGPISAELSKLQVSSLGFSLKSTIPLTRLLRNFLKKQGRKTLTNDMLSREKLEVHTLQ